MSAAAGNHPSTVERYSVYGAAHATACYLLAAALTAIVVAVSAPPELSVSSGEPLAWWQKSAQVYVWCLPWVIVAALIYFVPVMNFFRSRLSLSISLILSFFVGLGPAIVVLLACILLASIRSLLAMTFPLALIGCIVSLLGFALHVTVRRHLALLLGSAGVVSLVGVATLLATTRGA